MSASLIFFEYFAWHYSSGINEFLKAWKNVHWFWYHFFSVPILINTLFQPYRRIQEKYKRGFDPERFFETLIVNLIMRVSGFIVRTVFLLTALIIQILVIFIGILLFILYLGTPIFSLLGVGAGLVLFLI